MWAPFCRSCAVEQHWEPPKPRLTQREPHTCCRNAFPSRTSDMKDTTFPMQSDDGNKELLFLLFLSCFLPLPSDTHSEHGTGRQSGRTSTSSYINTCFLSFLHKNTENSTARLILQPVDSRPYLTQMQAKNMPAHIPGYMVTWQHITLHCTLLLHLAQQYDNTLHNAHT